VIRETSLKRLVPLQKRHQRAAFSILLCEVIRKRQPSINKDNEFMIKVSKNVGNKHGWKEKKEQGK
jgi:hypothetical protein